MSKVQEALETLASIENATHRAAELGGLISTLFKVHGVELIVTGELAFSSYADQDSQPAALELAPYSGKLSPRLLQEVMRGELRAEGGVDRWLLLEIPIQFHFESSLALRDLCRDFQTGFGVVKLRPAEEITAERVLAAVFPSENPVARGEALTILTQALVDAFQMDWIALRDLCHRPDYHVGEELAWLRTEAKKEADALGTAVDQIGGVWSEEDRLAKGDGVAGPVLAG